MLQREITIKNIDVAPQPIKTCTRGTMARDTNEIIRFHFWSLLTKFSNFAKDEVAKMNQNAEKI